MAILGASSIRALPVEERGVVARDDMDMQIAFTCPDPEIFAFCSRPNAHSYCTTNGQFVSDFAGTCGGCKCDGTGSGGCARCSSYEGEVPEVVPEEVPEEAPVEPSS